MKLTIPVRLAKLMMALILSTSASVVRAEEPMTTRTKLNSVQIAEIDRTLNVLLTGIPKDKVEKVRSTLSAQLHARAKHAPALEREHPLIRWNNEAGEVDLQSKADELADDLVKVLRNLSDPESGRDAFKTMADFALINGANSGDRVTRWLTYSAKTGGVLVTALVAGLITRWYGVRFHDPTSAEDGIIILSTTLALAGATGGFTYWDKTRGFAMWLLANRSGVQRRVAKAVLKRFWLRVAEGVEGLPAFAAIRSEKDPAKIAAEVRNVIVRRNPTIFDNCSSLLM